LVRPFADRRWERAELGLSADVDPTMLVADRAHMPEPLEVENGKTYCTSGTDAPGGARKQLRFGETHMQYRIGHWFRCVGVIALAANTLLFFSATALADPKACIAAHSTGQREAKAGHLRLATQLFTTCGSDESCPSQLRQECAEFLQSALQTMPTVIFSVTDEKGADISSVKVFSTDDLVVDGLDGRGIQIDPGKHRLRFLLPSGAILSSDVLIREGEKNRLIHVQVADDNPPEGPLPPRDKVAAPPAIATAPQTERSAPTSTAHDSASPNKPPLAAWLVGGAAVAALGVGTTFAFLGSSKKSDLNSCSPNCGSDQRSNYDNLKRDYLIADIGFAVGLVSAGVATWLFLSPTAPAESASGKLARRAPTRIQPSGAAYPGGGGLVLRGWF